MKKGDNKKNKYDLPPIPKHINNDSINEGIKGREIVSSEPTKLIRVKSQQLNLNPDYRLKGTEYLKEAVSIDKSSCEKNSATSLSLEGIGKLKEDKILKSTNEQVHKLTLKLEKTKNKKRELKATISKLVDEIERCSKMNKEINFGLHLKLKATIELFENFLLNNKELLTNDLYSSYSELKKKFETKIKECLEVEYSNKTLKSENKYYRLSIDTNQDILNKCAQRQIELKKKNRLLQMEVEERSRMINQMKTEYKNQFVELENKFNLLLKDNDDEIKSLQLSLKSALKELDEIKATSTLIVNQRSEIEMFFIEALKDVKRDIIAERKKNEKEKRQMDINNRSSYNTNTNTNTKEDESIYLKTIQKVNIKEIGPVNKEKLLRLLMAKFSQNKVNKNYSKLRELTLVY